MLSLVSLQEHINGSSIILCIQTLDNFPNTSCLSIFSQFKLKETYLQYLSCPKKGSQCKILMPKTGAYVKKIYIGHKKNPNSHLSITTEIVSHCYVWKLITEKKKQSGVDTWNLLQHSACCLALWPLEP